MSIRSHLRAATKECHQRLDSIMGQLRIFDSSDGYRNYLRTMLAMQVNFAHSLKRVEKSSYIAARAFSIEDCILTDLESVGFSQQRTTPQRSETGDEREATSADWGRSYVIEGSALGGKYLLSAAREKLPTVATMHFLGQLSEDAVHRWPQFVAALDSQTSINLEQATEASVEVFKYVEQQAQATFHSLHGSSSQ